MNIPDTYRPLAAALIIIDMQRAYFNAGELKAHQEQLVDRCNHLIAAFRRIQRPIIFIRTAHASTPESWTLNMRDDHHGYLFDGTEDVAFVAGLKVEDDDPWVTKLRDSAFHATTLDQLLRETHTDTVVLAGVSTQTCVGQTAADAYARNLRVILAEDAIGTHDHTYHEPTLAMLAKEYRQTRSNAEEIGRWASSQQMERAG